MNQSAGILLYRFNNHLLEVFLVHPGGPFWKGKDKGVWTIPKGEFETEEPLEAAKREFQEETGVLLNGNFIELKPVKQKSGKCVFAWAVEGDLDIKAIVSNSFKMEWPYKSGKWKSFPEVDKGEWFTIEAAVEKINAAQISFLLELQEKLQQG
ncbi:MAG TPA: NUDIX domain-containing protein [Flavisolibacter sp.]|nr:NUDIX domain-containing protein [Flavisolibacter sp.]